jgi:hypothetical protein
MRRRQVLGAAAGVAAASLVGGARPAPAMADNAVDVLLVLAVDVSRSVDERKAQLQRDGYYAALTHPEVLRVVSAGPLGAIAVSYVEWSGADEQRLVVPWTRVASVGDAGTWVARLRRHPPRSVGWTSVSGAIDFSRRVLGEAPFEATRRVIDISGDGVNNSGRLVEEARDEAVAEGITVNGLPILEDRPLPGAVPLDRYYEESVVGGPGSFVVAAEDFASFAQAVRRKLILEIAGLRPDTAPRSITV